MAFGPLEANASALRLAQDRVKTDKRWPSVRASILELWNVLDMIKDEDGCIRRNEYVKMNLKLQKALRDDYDDSEAMEAALDDWQSDSKGNASMDYINFEDAMVELLALWGAATKRTHSDLLTTVLAAITDPGDQGHRRFKKTEDIVQLAWAKDGNNCSTEGSPSLQYVDTRHRGGEEMHSFFRASAALQRMDKAPLMDHTTAGEAGEKSRSPPAYTCKTPQGVPEQCCSTREGQPQVP